MPVREDTYPEPLACEVGWPDSFLPTFISHGIMRGMLFTKIFVASSLAVERISSSTIRITFLIGEVIVFEFQIS